MGNRNRPIVPSTVPAGPIARRGGWHNTIWLRVYDPIFVVGKPGSEYALLVAIIKKLKLEKRGEGVSTCFDIIDDVVLSDFSGIWDG